MEDILKQIEQVDEVQLNEITNAVICRHNALYPGRKGAFLSLSADPHQQEQELENISSFLRKHKKM